MVQVPKEFQTPMPSPYPPSNHLIFEEWFFKNWTTEDKRDRLYLPIFVNGYQVGNNYGNNRPQMDKLQFYLDSLDRDKKYYIITQYDDGLLCDLTDLDIRVYAMSGKRVDYPLPLICQPLPYDHSKVEKKYLANFIGRITHPVRTEVAKALHGKEDCFVHIATHDYNQMHPMYYSLKIAESVFTICPRGYGWNSFRIAEALQYGSIPVIISDDYKEPHDSCMWLNNLYIKEDAVSKLYDTMKNAQHTWVATANRLCKAAYKEMYTYEANKKLILEDLKNY